MRTIRSLIVLSTIWLVTQTEWVASQAPPAGAPAQVRALSFGVPVQRDVRSGDVHEHELTAGAGDLVSGTLEWRGVAVLVEVIGRTTGAIRTIYGEPDIGSPPNRVGFVAPSPGVYRVRIRVFDRFDGGTQIAPGAMVPVRGTAAGSYTLRLDVAPVAARLRGAEPPVREDYSSPRLRRLAQDVKAGTADALPSFWREVAGNGPIVEEIAGNDRDADVTFLWRAIYDTRNVRLGWAPNEAFMSHLSGTDVWYTTVRLRRGSRIQYILSPNDRPDTRWATALHDPLNPRKFPDDPTYPFNAQSVLDMPGAPDEQWALRQPVRRGHIEERTIKSAMLNLPGFGAERPIWIYTPPGYDPKAGPYPLLVVLDGAAYVSNRFGNAPATLDNLINDGRIRPVIALFDLGNRGGGAAGRTSYREALVKEVLPMLRSSYPISTNPADNVIVGSSAGGLAAAEIALLHSDVFGNVLSQSGAFREGLAGGEPNATARAYLAADRKPIRFYLEVGLYDNVPAAGRPLYELVLDQTNLMGNVQFRDALRAKGYDVIYRDVGAGHDMLHWRAMLADGLMTLLKR